MLLKSAVNSHNEKETASEENVAIPNSDNKRTSRGRAYGSRIGNFKQFRANFQVFEKRVYKNIYNKIKEIS